ncbi:MAG: hypothetical protein QMC67_03405 [Candidatus Wallbacteria bacterium]
MLKRLGLLLLVLSLVAFTTGCSLFGSDDSSTPTTTNVLTVEGQLPIAVPAAPGLTAPSLAAATDYLSSIEPVFEEVTSAGAVQTITSGASATINTTTGAYSAQFAFSTPRRIFIGFRTKTNSRLILKRYLGLIPSSPLLPMSTKITGVDVTPTTTAQAIVIKESAAKESVLTTLNTYLVNPSAITSSTAVANTELTTAVNTVAPTNAGIVQSLVTIVTAVTKVVTTNVALVVNNTVDLNSYTATQTAATTLTNAELTATSGLAVGNATVNTVTTTTATTVQTTVETNANSIPVLNQIAADNGYSDAVLYNNKLTVGTQTFNLTSCENGITFKLDFNKALDALNNNVTAVIEVVEVYGGVTTTRKYYYNTPVLSGGFNWTDDFSALQLGNIPGGNASQITFGLKAKNSGRTHQLMAGTYTIKLVSLSGLTSNSVALGGLNQVSGSMTFTTSAVTTPGEVSTVNFLPNDNGASVKLFDRAVAVNNPSISNSKIKGGTFEVTFSSNAPSGSTAALQVTETSNNVTITRTYYYNQSSLVNGVNTFNWTDDFEAPVVSGTKITIKVKSTATHMPAVGAVYTMKTVAVGSNVYPIQSGASLTVTQ